MKEELTRILQNKGLIVSDETNVNGRFVTVRVADPSIAAWELVRELPAAFPRGHFSMAPTYWGNGKYHVQANSKRPRLLCPGIIYPADAFGETTEIYLVK